MYEIILFIGMGVVCFVGIVSACALLAEAVDDNKS